MIDRNSFEDAKNSIEKIIPNQKIRDELLKFLIDSINFANRLNSGNWNLNLDKQSGNILMFNIGYEWSFEIRKRDGRVVILVLEKHLLNYLSKKSIEPDKKIESWISVGQVMAKVPDSRVCNFHWEEVPKYLKLLKEANRSFIEYAINNTTISSSMKEAHSKGAIEYLNSIKRVPNPTYTLSRKSLDLIENNNRKAILKLTDSQLKKRIDSKSKPQKVKVETETYVRNPYLSELVKRKANGVCQDCGQPAPFISKVTGEPYLETHHIVPLSQGGSDTEDNLIALCPNCHRKRHYG